MRLLALPSPLRLSIFLLLTQQPSATQALPFFSNKLPQGIERRVPKPTYSVVPVDGGSGASASSSLLAGITVIQTETQRHTKTDISTATITTASPTITSIILPTAPTRTVIVSVVNPEPTNTTLKASVTSVGSTSITEGHTLHTKTSSNTPPAIVPTTPTPSSSTTAPSTIEPISSAKASVSGTSYSSTVISTSSTITNPLVSSITTSGSIASATPSLSPSTTATSLVSVTSTTTQTVPSTTTSTFDDGLWHTTYSHWNSNSTYTIQSITTSTYQATMTTPSQG